MRDYVDCVLALLPFEPQAHARLGGPRCVYVGHPLVERLDELTPHFRDRAGARSLLILPGSRLAEVRRMTPIYGETLELLLRERADFDVVIPVAPSMEQALRRELQGWPMTPRLIGQAEKFAAFRKACAALVTSGAATLELALAEVPMAVAYRVSHAESLLRFLVNVDSIVLPNLIVGENVTPEFLQDQATPRALAGALRPLIGESAARDAQLAAFKRVRARLLEAGRSPSAKAADVVLEYASRGRA